MGIEELKKNVEHAKKIISDMRSIYERIKDLNERQFYENSIRAMMYQLKLVNKTVPSLLNDISLVKKLPSEAVVSKTNPEIVTLAYISPYSKEKRYVSVNKADKKLFLKELQLSETGMMNLQKKDIKKKEVSSASFSGLARISNKFFFRLSEKLAPKFSDIADDLRKANIRFMIQTYLSIAFFVSTLVFLVSSVLMGIAIAFYFFLISYVWVPFLLLAISLIAFYFYPASEKSSVQKEIAYELPFATIYMAAIAGSDIEPTKIFRIISGSNEYPYVGREISKINNQIDVYGYDLVTALKSVAKQTSNKELAELFSGLATNINTGGELKSYLEKKSENFLNDYKLERNRYADLAGTFMDVYISILIAAPLILMMMFIVMGVTNMGPSFLSTDNLMILSIGLVAVVNVIFIFVLNLKQPRV